jgi:hypothetical protein
MLYMVIGKALLLLVRDAVKVAVLASFMLMMMFMLGQLYFLGYV